MTESTTTPRERIRNKTTDFLRMNITPEAKDLLRRTAKKRGITMTAVLEQAIRDTAAGFGITTTEETT